VNIELYHRKNCPYSAKVRDYITAHQLKKSIQYHEVDLEEDSLERLEQMTGDDQVPCLVVNKKPILESDEILEWLEVHEDELFAGDDSLDD
jgi:glutaredoxin 3